MSGFGYERTIFWICASTEIEPVQVRVSSRLESTHDESIQIPCVLTVDGVKGKGLFGLERSFIEENDIVTTLSKSQACDDASVINDEVVDGSVLEISRNSNYNVIGVTVHTHTNDLRGGIVLCLDTLKAMDREGSGVAHRCD
jgi:hypothetical protein